MDPLTTVLLYTSGGSLAAGLAGLLFRGGRPLSRTPLGWANALAAGLMFGAAYAILREGLERGVWAATLGGLIGVGLVHASHRFARTADLDLNLVDQSGPGYGRRIVVVQALHSAWEGVAIGAAAGMDLSLGLILAGILALHNIAEGTVLIAVLKGQGWSLSRASALAVASNVPQVLFAGLCYVLLAPDGNGLALAAGIGVGALVQLVLVELLPEAYRQAGPVSIALVTSLALGVTVFLAGMVA